MEQYEKSGPSSASTSDSDLKIERIINDLRQKVEAQDRRINELERDLRRLRNDLRTAINAANTIVANRQRNG